MKKLNFLFISIISLLVALSGCSTNEQKNESEKKVELTVSAASSLQNALTDITAAFVKDHPNVKINFNFGASGALQQQISQGAPVDLFFSAAKDKFNKLVQDGLIEKKKGSEIVGNELVLVVPNDSKAGIKGFKDLTKAEKIAIGTPESVPAGKYAKETLGHLKIWNAVQGKVVFGKDVRQVLTYVETGNVDAGIVYKTDALISKKVKMVATADETTHAPIVYPAGVIKNSKHQKEAEQLFKFLQNDQSKKIFEKNGFKGLN